MKLFVVIDEIRAPFLPFPNVGHASTSTFHTISRNFKYNSLSYNKGRINFIVMYKDRVCRFCAPYTTHVKLSHLVASLLTSRQQVVFALLVSSCQQVWNKLLTTCNNLVDIIRLVARLFQQVRHSHDITILLQPCVVNLVTFLLYHDCTRLVGTTL
jgi:hypothetical protein